MTSYDTSLGASAVWNDLGPTPGPVLFSQPILIPAIPIVGSTPAAAAKFLVPINTYTATSSAAQLFNTGTKLWEPVTSNVASILNGACGLNFKPGILKCVTTNDETLFSKY